MTKQDLKKRLEDYWYDNQYYIEKSKEVEKFKLEIAKIIDPNMTLGNKSAFSEQLNDQYTQFIQKQLEETNKLLIMLENKEKVEGYIQLLPQPHRTLFYLKYITCLTFDQVAAKMNYSTKRIYQLHNEGLEKILDKLSGPDKTIKTAV